MLFNSYGFVFTFLPVALAGVFSLGRFGRRFGASWLALTSLTFYGLWNPRFVVLLLASIAFNFGVGEAIHANLSRPERQHGWLVVGITGDLAVLIYYKYLAALVGFAAGLGFTSLHVPSILLPLGISFFTFTQIGYLVDIRQGVARDRGLLNYMLFVTFFPHLIAGPILHNREIMPQFAQAQTYRFSSRNLTVGIVIFVIGLAKKCLFADPIASNVATGFAAPDHLTMLSAWQLMLTYAVQLYFDFSGYTDMAIGIARMFNVRFPANFNSPYKASSIIDFWQRWHMTLSRFLALYIFNPIALAIARNRGARGLPTDRAAQAKPSGFLPMVAFPILVTMGLAGIWHGAGLKFLIFGLLHGIYLTINHAWRLMRATHKVEAGRRERATGGLLTIAATLVALVFFRAPSMEEAWQTLGAMVGTNGPGSIAIPGGILGAQAGLGMAFAGHGAAAATPALKFAMATLNTSWIALLWLIVLAAPNTQQILHRYEPVLGRVTPDNLKFGAWRPTAGWAAALGVVGAFAAMAIAGTTDFVYFQF